MSRPKTTICPRCGIDQKKICKSGRIQSYCTKCNSKRIKQAYHMNPSKFRQKAKEEFRDEAQTNVPLYEVLLAAKKPMQSKTKSKKDETALTPSTRRLSRGEKKNRSIFTRKLKNSRSALPHQKIALNP